MTALDLHPEELRKYRPLEAVALGLDGFYSVFERILTHIAKTLDGTLLGGED